MDIQKLLEDLEREFKERIERIKGAVRGTSGPVEPSPPIAPLPPTPAPPYLRYDRGVSYPRWWDCLQLHTLLAVLVDNRIGVLHIELFGAAERNRQAYTSLCIDEALSLYNICIVNSIRLWITLVNENSKNLMSQGDDWFKNICGRLGYCKGLLITPVSEARTEKSFRWMDIARSVLSHTMLVDNTSCRVKKIKPGFAYGEYHPFKLNDFGPDSIKDKLIVLGDTSEHIAKLTKDGTRDCKRHDPAKVKAWVKAGLAKNRTCIVTYLFNHDSIDFETLKAIGDA